VLNELVRRFGAGKVMLGSDYPAGMGNFKPGEGLGALEFDDAGREAFSGGNAVRVFGLGGVQAGAWKGGRFTLTLVLSPQGRGDLQG
jgi:hypothetical protein